MEVEPIGEERDDLRIGALASVLLNLNIDTKAVGGSLQPQSYISGWGKDLVYVLTIKPPELDEIVTSPSSSPLSDPIAWENFTSELVKGKEILR